MNTNKPCPQKTSTSIRHVFHYHLYSYKAYTHFNTGGLLYCIILVCSSSNLCLHFKTQQMFCCIICYSQSQRFLQCNNIKKFKGFKAMCKGNSMDVALSLYVNVAGLFLLAVEVKQGRQECRL